VEARIVNVHVTVQDKKGQLVPNLGAADFTVLEDREPTPPYYFSGASKQSLLVVLLIDTSTSQSEVLSRERHIATKFLERVLGPADQAAVVTFDSNAYVLQSATSDLASLGRALEHIEPFAPGFSSELPPWKEVNGTRTCAAVAWVADWQTQASRQADRKVVILISDGVDAELNSKLKPALEAALRNDVTIYSIRMIDPGAYGWLDQPRVQAGEQALLLLARETGGLFFLGNNPSRVEAAFAQIAAEVRAQYSLGFVPRYFTYNGRFHRISVAVKQKDLNVRARTGYFSPSRETDRRRAR